MADSKGTVLIVDDEEPVRQVASEILKYLGYSVLVAESGEKAVEALRQGARPDVVLLDLIMPGMSGYQAFKAIRQIEPNLPILISSGYSDRTAVGSLRDQGADGFVNKPYHIDTLAKHIEKALLGSNLRK